MVYTFHVHVFYRVGNTIYTTNSQYSLLSGRTVLDFEFIIVLNFVVIDHLFSIWILPTKSMLAWEECKSAFQKLNQANSSFDQALTWPKENN